MAQTSFLDDSVQATYAACRVAILPVPYEGTVSYGRGASRGPAAILAASHQVEMYDEQLAAEPYRCGIWTAPALDVEGKSAEQVARAVETRVGAMLDDGKWVVLLGGEHSITPGAVRASASRHPGLHVVQLDAHADLRESYLGDRWSHASAMARALEIAPVHAIGIRSYSEEEAARIGAGMVGYQVTHGWEMQGADWIDLVVEGLRGRPVHLTIDLDFFDPSLMPATGTPEPGGGSWWPTLHLLERMFRVAKVVSCDVVELAPIRGISHPDFTAARLVYKLIGYACGCSAEASPRR